MNNKKCSHWLHFLLFKDGTTWQNSRKHEDVLPLKSERKPRRIPV